MKARALYHLLVTRLGQLTNDGSSSAFGVALKGTLQVDHDREWFVLRWRWVGRDFEINAPSKSFALYKRGDIVHPNRGEAYREQNWREAEALLRRMADISGAELPDDRQPGALSPLNLPPAAAGPGLPLHVLIASLGAAGLTLAVADTVTAATAFLCAFALCILYVFQRHTLMRQEIRWAESALVAAGAPIAAAMNSVPLGASVLAASAALLSHAEGNGKLRASWEWPAGGLLLGAAVPLLGAPGWFVIGFVAVALTTLHALAPARFGRANVLTCMLASVAGAAIASLAAPIPQELTPLREPAASATWLVGLSALSCFGLWWIVGSQSRLFPWLSFGVILTAAFATLGLGGPSRDYAGLAAFCGYLVCALARLYAAFFRSRRNSGQVTSP